MASTITQHPGTLAGAPDIAELAAVAALLSDGEVNGALADLHALDEAFIGDPQVEYLFGVAYLRKRDGAAAISHLSRCRDARPHEAEVHYHLGLAYLMDETRDDQEAIGCFAAALDRRPDFFAAGYELGQLCQRRGDFEKALACFVRIAHHATESEQLAEASLAIDAALKLSPESPELLVYAARLMLARNRLDEAAAALARASALLPDNADLWNERGLVSYKSGNDEEAARYYERALELRSIFPQTHNNLGNLHACAGRSAQAVKHYGYAVAQLPGYSDAWYNLAREQLVLGDRDAAQASCERAIETGEDAALARAMLADLLLARGRYGDGWRWYESRVLANTGDTYHTDPRVRGRILPLPSTLDLAALEGSHVLVLPEPSVGDELAFLRFLPALLARGVAVDYAPSPSLRPLLEANVSKPHGLRLNYDKNSDYAAVLASGDLPLLLGHGDDTPVPAPFTVAPADDDVAELAVLLDDLEPGPILALTWRAGLAEDGLRRKSLAMEDVANLARVWPGPVLAVQRSPEAGEIAALERLAGRTVHDFCSLNDDLRQMAALLHVVDEYVGVSNTNMHLMACLGNRARVFVKHPGEWRWMADTVTTPWAPRARLYRERVDGAWADAWQSLLADLSADYELLCD